MLCSDSLQLSAADQLSPSEALRKILVVEDFQIEICGVMMLIYGKISHETREIIHIISSPEEI